MSLRKLVALLLLFAIISVVSIHRLLRLHLLPSRPVNGIVLEVAEKPIAQAAKDPPTFKRDGVDCKNLQEVPPTPVPPNATLVMCTISKDEEPYIDEWLDYHQALGFDHFFIYENTERPELQHQWGSSRHHPYVTFRHWPGPAQQPASYQHCGRQARRENHTWAAFFDVDEFLVLHKYDHSVKTMLHDLLHEGSLAIRWKLFGTGGRQVYSPEPVTYRFPHRHVTGAEQHIKSIVKLEDLDTECRHWYHPSSGAGMMNPHELPLYPNRTQRATNGTAFKGPFLPNGPTDVAALHHYHTKSYKEYVRKRLRGRATTTDSARVDPGIQKAFEYMRDQSQNGTVFDDSAWQALKRLVPKYSIYDEGA